ncbi:hypothetical protein SB719_18975, partial [Pantoea sp. SIMBA_079]|uniref:hypothetical protein n=1 Tax=Pantoea sp. SIMBA_079 TaxID=3085817 RepID=UPI003996971F
ARQLPLACERFANIFHDQMLCKSGIYTWKKGHGKNSFHPASRFVVKESWYYGGKRKWKVAYIR